jgi:hypothetical protein
LRIFFEGGFCGICWKNGGLLWCFGGYLAVKSVGSVVCCVSLFRERHTPGAKAPVLFGQRGPSLTAGLARSKCNGKSNGKNNGKSEIQGFFAALRMTSKGGDDDKGKDDDNGRTTTTADCEMAGDCLVVGGGFAACFEGADEEEDGDGQEGDPAYEAEAVHEG